MLGFKPAAGAARRGAALPRRRTASTPSSSRPGGGRSPSTSRPATCCGRASATDTEIYLDANRGWTANEAMEVLRRTEGLGLSMLEEPCDAGGGDGPPPAGAELQHPDRGRRKRAHRSATSPGNCSPAAATRSASRPRAAASPKPSRSSASARARRGRHHGQPDRHPDRAASPRSPLARPSRPPPAGPGSSPTILDMTDDLLAEPLEDRTTAPSGSARSPASARPSTRTSCEGTGRTRP